MAGIASVEAPKRKEAPKQLHHLEIHPRLGGGHVIQHHYTSYQHEPEHHSFDDGAAAMKHIAKHAGLPHPQLDEQEDSEPQPLYEHETRKKA